jgi:hypothetical protein
MEAWFLFFLQLCAKMGISSRARFLPGFAVPVAVGAGVDPAEEMVLEGPSSWLG